MLTFLICYKIILIMKFIFIFIFNAIYFIKKYEFLNIEKNIITR
jgi:hypothetical protein